ncbi:hypothetical protein GCM10009624_19430 [Gordonia sinesedis]
MYPGAFHVRLPGWVARFKRMRRIPRTATLVVLVLAFCSACATGGTPTPTNTAPAATVPTNVAPTALVLDASDSMLTEDAPGARFDAARRAATGLVNALPPNTQLAVLAYGTGTSNRPADYAAGCRDVRTVIPIGPVDARAVRTALDDIRPRGFTPIAESLRRAASTLPDNGKSAIVLVSDGEDTCGDPPCPVAESLKRDNPNLQISTLGFKTDETASADLRCIADATGGVFVTAANDAQLRARLLATQDTEASHNALNGAAYQGNTLGESLVEIRKRNPDFPAGGRRSGDQTIVEWRDCEWVFGPDGTLVEIRPRQGARTVDGLGIGSTVRDFIRLYGAPLQQSSNPDGTRTLLFAPDPTTTTGYRATADAPGDDARITRIIVCNCAPRTMQASGEPTRTVLRPVTRSGGTTAGWLKDTTRSGGYYACTTNPVPGVTEAGIYWCSGSSGANQGVCAPAGQGAFLLCVTDPFTKTVLLLAASAPLPTEPRPMPDPVPFGVVLDDGTRCSYSVFRGYSNPNSRIPDGTIRYSCGSGADATYLWSTGDAYPIDRGASWTVRLAKDGDSPVSIKRVTELLYVGFDG